MSVPIRVRLFSVWCCVIWLFGVPAVSGSDVRGWFDFQTGRAIGETLTARLNLGARWEDDVSHYASSIASVGLQARRSSWFTLAGYYRWQQDYSQVSDVDLREDRFYIDATLKHQFGGWWLSGRNRFEYRVRESRDDSFRYRLKFTETKSSGLTRWVVSPYAAQEFFFDEGEEAFAGQSRMRVFFGLKSDPVERFEFMGARFKNVASISSDWYVMYESEERVSGWEDVVVVGMKLGVFF